MPKNAANINFGGGGTFWVNPDVDEPNIPDGSPSTWIEVGFIEEMRLTYKDESDRVYDNFGEVVQALARSAERELEIVLLQSGKPEFDFLVDKAEYQGYYAVPVADGAILQRWRFRQIALKPGFSVVFNSKDLRTITARFALQQYKSFPEFIVLPNQILFTHWGQTEFAINSITQPFYELT